MPSIINTIKPTSMQPPPRPGARALPTSHRALTSPLRSEGPVRDLFLKFGTNSLQGFPILTFSFLSVVHPLKVYEVIAHNIYVHWISAAFKYLRVSSKINKNDQENGYSCIENISIFFSKMTGMWDPVSARTLGCTARSPFVRGLCLKHVFAVSAKAAQPTSVH